MKRVVRVLWWLWFFGSCTITVVGMFFWSPAARIWEVLHASKLAIHIYDLSVLALFGFWVFYADGDKSKAWRLFGIYGKDRLIRVIAVLCLAMDLCVVVYLFFMLQ